MKYIVTSRYLRDFSDRPIAGFDDINDARLFIERKMAINQDLKVTIIYKIMQFDEVVEEFDPNKMQADSSDSRQSGRVQTASFRPSPLSTTLTPPSTPKKWIIDKDEEKNKEK